MSSIPFNDTFMKASSTFNKAQASDINAFFSSTGGIITFAIIWLLCVCGMFAVTGYLLVKKDDEVVHDHISAHDAEARGAMIPHRPIVEIELPTVQTNEDVDNGGRYRRLV